MASARRGAVTYHVNPEHASALLWVCEQVPRSVSHRSLPTYSCLFLEERNFPQIIFISDLQMISDFLKNLIIAAV